MVDQLQKLGDLFKSGVLTKEEFDNAKNKILTKNPPMFKNNTFII